MIILILIVLICLTVCYTIWQYFELRKFEVSEYGIFSEKLCEEHAFVVLADLHGFEYGRENEELVKAIKACNPQTILIAGDMIVSKKPETYQKAARLLERLVEIAPVYYGFGNHESRASGKELVVSKAFERYIREIKALGIQLLQNENTVINMGEDRIQIGGIEIPLNFYEKGCSLPMEENYIGQLMGTAETGQFQILLAHNPLYSEQYAAWGADLTLCGHNHGGLVRIPGIGSLMSPQLTFFPRYNDGMYEIHDKRIIVSRGLGTHTFHVRIFNRAELIVVKLLPNTLEKKNGNR